MTQFKEKPDIQFPQWAQDLGFKDHSWNQDAIAVAFLAIPWQGSFKSGLKLYVTETDPQAREISAMPRFTLTTGRLDSFDDGDVHLYAGEDEVKVAAICQRFLELIDDGLNPNRQQAEH